MFFFLIKSRLQSHLVRLRSSYSIILGIIWELLFREHVRWSQSQSQTTCLRKSHQLRKRNHQVRKLRRSLLTISPRWLDTLLKAKIVQCLVKVYHNCRPFFSRYHLFLCLSVCRTCTNNLVLFSFSISCSVLSWGEGQENVWKKWLTEVWHCVFFDPW